MRGANLAGQKKVCQTSLRSQRTLREQYFSVYLSSL